MGVNAARETPFEAEPASGVRLAAPRVSSPRRCRRTQCRESWQAELAGLRADLANARRDADELRRAAAAHARDVRSWAAELSSVVSKTHDESTERVFEQMRSYLTFIVR